LYLVVAVSSLNVYIEKYYMNYSSAVLPIAPFPFLGAFAKVRRAIISLVISVRPHGTTRLPLDRFLWNLILDDFSKICRENSSFIKIGQE